MRLLLLSVLLVFAACTDATSPPVPASSLDADLRAIAADYPDALIAVALRDDATGTSIDLNGDTLLHAASTMKVPVMVEVFRLADAGELALDDSLLVENRFRSIVDGSEYAIGDDSDDAIYQRLGGHMTVRELVYQMITVSSNLATNILIDRVGAENVQRTTEAMGTTQMQVLRGVEDLKAFEQGLSNSATANDLAVMMDAIRTDAAVSPQASEAMRAVLFDQQFDEMIPAGLPDGVGVAHKTGNITGINHDAAIVYPPDGAPYTLVILTRGFDTPDEAAAVGARIARTVHTALRPDTDA